MKLLLFLCLLGVTFAAQPTCEIPHGHDLTQLVDGGFARMDTQPKDDKVTTLEYDMIIQLDDKNNDSCVSFAEYHNPETQALYLEVNQKMYQHFNPDGDDCLDVDEMNAQFGKIDKDGDGLVDKHEYEQYYTNLLKHLYPCHGGAGK
ncbi:hypothetical protein MAR_035965 [Mya arenaria]|uniref:EF-hand domain-containing protein n=1 Tax=Mya arenaria TaxID=6604 RepID=A0ABY7EP65_MYAAR|nr:uncharacterized protein LOC128241889 [Mya arenaria]WAR10889.1 hypothetical protein MAR_035965 [Mya arenaria]